MKSQFLRSMFNSTSPLKRSFGNFINNDDDEPNSSVFNDISHTLNQRPEISFSKTGYEVVGKKKGGESSGTILGDVTNKENQFLVKEESIVTEFIGLSVYKEIVAILGSTIIVPECFLERDDQNGKLGLFVKMIPDFVPNSEVKSVHAAPTKRKPKFPGAAYQDLVMMMVIGMLIGDNDCSPDNSGSKGNRGVRLDLGNAFYWVYKQDFDFKQKLQDYFRAFYGERNSFQRFMGEFQALDALLILAQPENLDKIQSSLDVAIVKLTSFITEQELQALTFKNESISGTDSKAIVERKYQSFEELRNAFSGMITKNIKILPVFLAAVKAEVTSLNEFNNSFDVTNGSPPRHHQTSSSSLYNAQSFHSPQQLGHGFNVQELLGVSPIAAKSPSRNNHFERD